MNFRLLSVFLGALIALQPILGFAVGEKSAREDAVVLKKKALEMRAGQKVTKKTRSMHGLSCSGCVADGCCGCFVIRPCDFGLDQDTTVVITEPGKYTLQQDVVFFPAEEFTPAILILSDNVTLDLCEHTLSQGNDTPNAYGVQIGQGYFYEDPDFVLKNIEVQNGNIIDFTAIGVFCYNGSFDGPTAEVAFEDLRFLDLNVLDCGTTDFTYDFGASINLDSLASINGLSFPETRVAYKDVRIERCNLNRCKNGSGSVNISTYENLIICDTQCNNSFTYNSYSGLAAYSVPGRNLQMFRCQGNGTTDTDPTSGIYFSEVIGLWPGRAVNVYLEDCQFNDTFGETNVVVNGASMTGIYNLIAVNCQFNNSRGGSEALIITGVHMSDRRFQQFETNGLKFINCQFNGARVSDDNLGGHDVSSISGFYSTSLRNVIFENCQACNIVTNNLGYNAYGICLATLPEDPDVPFGNSDNIVYKNCVTSDISGGRDAIGIFTCIGNINRTSTQASETNIVVENCIAERISSNSSSDRVAGIAQALFPVRDYGVPTHYPFAKNLYVRDCRVSDVHAGKCNPLSAGILVEAVCNPVLENNSVSDCDVGILFTGTNDIIPNAFQLAATRTDALASPPVPIDIDAPVGLSSLESFENKTHHNTVQVLVPDDVDAQHDFLFPTNADLTALGWESGDKVVYHTGDGLLIPGLVDGQTYYAIVYSPGFTKRGLVQNNNVSNCLVAGYKDDRCPTKSAWINNMALLNGHPKPSHHANFAIKWQNRPQVDKGTLGEYPKNPNKNFNTSLIYAEKKHHHSSDRR